MCRLPVLDWVFPGSLQPCGRESWWDWISIFIGTPNRFSDVTKVREWYFMNSNGIGHRWDLWSLRGFFVLRLFDHFVRLSWDSLSLREPKRDVKFSHENFHESLELHCLTTKKDASNPCWNHDFNFSTKTSSGRGVQVAKLSLELASISVVLWSRPRC